MGFVARDSGYLAEGLNADLADNDLEFSGTAWVDPDDPSRANALDLIVSTTRSLTEAERQAIADAGPGLRYPEDFTDPPAD